jgi:inosine/xanthosine triphosphatase
LKKIFVGSGNPVKIRACLQAFRRVFPDQEFVAEGRLVPSGVSNQPLSDAETFAGALERATGAQRIEPSGDFWCGVEGGIEEIQGEFHVFAWIVVKSPDRMGRGRTGTFILPPGIAALIRQGHELGAADDIFFSKTGSKQDTGSVGILTNNVITRGSYYEEACVLALIPFLKTELFA